MVSSILLFDICFYIVLWFWDLFITYLVDVFRLHADENFIFKFLMLFGFFFFSFFCSRTPAISMFYSVVGGGERNCSMLSEPVDLRDFYVT